MRCVRVPPSALASYTPATSRPLLAAHTRLSLPFQRGATAYQPLVLTVRQRASPLVSIADAAVRSESRRRLNSALKLVPNPAFARALSRNGIGYAAVFSTNRRMPNAVPLPAFVSAAAFAARSMSCAPYAYAVCPCGKRVVARLQREIGGMAASRAAARMISGASVLALRP